jgi:thiol:disulfide interchange protein DsbD
MMLRQTNFSICCLLLVFILSACSRTAPAPGNVNTRPIESPAYPVFTASLNFVKAYSSEAELPAGGSAEAIVSVTVQNGYHVNANPPSFPYLKATQLVVQPAQGLSVGFITYPTSITKKFAFSEQPLAVYEGEVLIKIMLKAAASAPAKSYSLAAKLTVQVCDDQVCYPPGILDISIPVTVK